MALITVAEAKDYVRLTGTDKDSLLTRLIDRVSVRVARDLGYPAAAFGGVPSIEQATYTRYLCGPGGRELHLDVYPVIDKTDITSIEDDTDETFDGTTTLVASSDYRLLDDGIVLLLPDSDHGSWSKTENRTIKAIYAAGYTAVPDDIKQAAALQVAHWYNQRGTVGQRSVTAGAGTVSMESAELLPGVRQLIAPFRLRRRYGSQ